jgi:hypothetical protein
MIDDRHAAILRAHDLRGLEERLDEMAAERCSLHPFGHPRQVGPEGRLPGAGDMALEAGEVRSVEDERAPTGVATGSHVGHKPFPRLGEERFGQVLSGRTRRQKRFRGREADDDRSNVQNT